jgi:hypothetical protein
MTPEEIDLVFHNNTFYSSQGTKDEKGTGLGLLIVKISPKRTTSDLRFQAIPEKVQVFTLHIPSRIKKFRVQGKTLNPKQETSNEKPRARNSKLETRNYSSISSLFFQAAYSLREP